MLRALAASAVFLLSAVCASLGQSPPAELPPRSVVYRVREADALNGFQEDAAVTRTMVDQLVLAVTGQSDVRSAWRSLVSAKDVVGIKVATTGGQYFSSHRGVVEAVASGLEQAGVPRSRIIVWDRESANLRTAGFVTRPGGYTVRGIDPPKGLDPAAVFFAPAFGRLIWGDLSFQIKRDALKNASADQLSPESHLPFLLSKEITKIVNVATLSDEAGCGVAGALYNVTVPNVDNARRFTQRSGVASICDLYLDERIGARTVLHLVDGLIAQFAAGPQFSPNYAFSHRTLYASKDPVALDVTLVGKIEGWRKEAKLPPIAPLASWLTVGEELGLGHSSPADIDIVDLRSRR